MIDEVRIDGNHLIDDTTDYFVCHDTLPIYTYKEFMRYLTPIPNINVDILRRKIKRVIFNDPATIVFWDDGTKTVVKCGKHDYYNEEVGLMACIVKKITGNTGRWNEILKDWCYKEDK